MALPPLPYPGWFSHSWLSFWTGGVSTQEIFWFSFDGDGRQRRLWHFVMACCGFGAHVGDWAPTSGAPGASRCPAFSIALLRLSISSLPSEAHVASAAVSSGLGF